MITYTVECPIMVLVISLMFSNTFVLLIKIAALQGRLRSKKSIGHNVVHRKVEQSVGKYSYRPSQP